MCITVCYTRYTRIHTRDTQARMLGTGRVADEETRQPRRIEREKGEEERVRRRGREGTRSASSQWASGAGRMQPVLRYTVSLFISPSFLPFFLPSFFPTVPTLFLYYLYPPLYRAYAPSLSLSLSSLYPCKSYIIAGSLFACCVGRVQRASLFISNTMCINVCTSKIVRVYIYMYIYESCTRMYICFSFFARLYNDTDCVPVSTGLACRRVYPCTKYSSDTVHQ